MFTTYSPCTRVGVKGHEPPTCRVLKWDTPSSKSLGLQVPGPQCRSCSEGMDAARAAPRGLLCAVCLKIIWVYLIVSQLQHGSPQSCWKERSCWHYGWYLFRAAHCAWQRLPGGRPVTSAKLPMQMDLIPGNVYSRIKYMVNLKFFRQTWYQTHPSLFESVG